MNVLILGSGGREHAICKKVQESPLADKIFVAPGNAGTALDAHNLPINVTDFEAIGKAVTDHNISFVIVGPEAPLVEGITDFFMNSSDLKHVAILGPDKEASQLEGSKSFAKAFMQAYEIPTAAYSAFDSTQVAEAHSFLSKLEPPYVIKADGLAAGKGVLIDHDIHAARQHIEDILHNAKFGDAGNQVVIEEFLEGIEMSVFVLTDGKDYVLLPEAKDYKRIGEQDTGLNTGGMGSVSPVPFADADLMDKIRERIVSPTIRGIAEKGYHYRGFIFIGLMIKNGEPFVIEYNVRMGDPETQSVFPRIDSDILELMYAAAKGNLAGKGINVKPEYCSSVVMVAGGYPENYHKGDVITGLEMVEDVQVIHAGTKLTDENTVVTSGGRVLAVTGMGKNMEESLKKNYQEIKKINFDNSYYRKDIGFDLKK